MDSTYTITQHTDPILYAPIYVYTSSYTNFCTITKPIIMGDEISKLLTSEWDTIKRGETYHDVLP